MSRIAVHADGDLASRIARTLLAERGVRIGMFGDAPTGGRVSRISDLDRVEVLIVESDRSVDEAIVDEAVERDIPIIFAEDGTDFVFDDSVVVLGAANPVHVAIAAASRELQSTGELIHATAARTMAGRPRRSGVPVTFPEPIGPLWGYEANPPPAPFPIVGQDAPTDSDYEAAIARVSFGSAEGVEDVTFGVVDLRPFFAAASLAATALTASRGLYGRQPQGPGDPDGVYLDTLTRAGIVVGKFRRT